MNVQTAREEKPKSEGVEPEKSEKIDRLPVLEGIHKYAAGHVLLVGKPGSGKSTALERLLLQEAELAQADPQVAIPVLLKLRDLRTSVLDLLRYSLVNRDPSLAPIDLAAMLAEGRFLLLWDGVNELVSAQGKRIKFYTEFHTTITDFFISWLFISPYTSRS